ncbi:ABC transporter permease [bacterium]|nr:ABC transporter permease [bacterium]
MKHYIIRRFVFLIPLVLGVVTLVFLIIRLVPGDPVEIMLGEQASMADRAQLRRDLGLDKPYLKQYQDFLVDLGKGRLGRSITLYPGQPVIKLLSQRYPFTLELAVLSMAIALLIALPLGIVSALRPNSWIDQFSLTLSLFGISIPNFWLGPMLIIIFCYRWVWLPMPSQGGWLTVILPAVTLGLGMSSVLIRMTRCSFLETIRLPFMKTARAKGLSSRTIYLKHGLRNALNPIITILGLQFGVLLAGAVITETVFAWPGIGYLVIEAIRARDYPIVQGCILVISLTYVLVNLVTDLMYQWVDPRVSLS